MSLAAEPNAMMAGGMLTGPPAPPPDPFADHGKLLARIRDRYDKWKSGREPLMRAIWRNILFYRSHQWIVYSRSLNAWRPAANKRSMPRPVRNRFASSLDAYISVFARSEPVSIFRPASETADDQAAADVAQRIMEVIDAETDQRLQRQILAHWIGFAGGAWLEAGYDPSPEHGLRLLQDERCLACGQTQPPSDNGTCQGPLCQGQGLPTVPATDPTGQPVGQQVPIGKMFDEVCSPFEMYADLSIPNWNDQREYIRRKSVGVDTAKRRWPTLTIVADAGADMGEIYQGQLPYLAGYQEETGSGANMNPVQRGLQPAHRVIETWYWTLPDQDFPEGACLIQVGNQIAHAGPLPYYDTHPDGSPKYFLPATHFPTKIVPGSSWPKTVADDLALLQVEYNEVCSLILAILKRTSNPVWMVPEGANVTNFTGDPGQILRYNALGPTAKGPERIPGQGIPSGLIAWLEILQREFEEIGQTFDVLKGNRPPGVSAGVALQMLQERAMSKFGGQFVLWEQAHATHNRKKLTIFRQFASEPRQLKIMGKNGAWEIQKFMSADLQGQIDVVAEAGSGMPKSTMIERATVEQAMSMFPDLRSDPEVRSKVLALYDLSNLTPGMHADQKNAAMQCEQWEALAQNPAQVAQIASAVMAALKTGEQVGQPVPYSLIQQELAQRGIQVPRIRDSVDGHAIFALEIGNWLKGELAQSLPLPIQQLAEMNHSEHVHLFQASQGQPPPKVSIALKGDVPSDLAAQLAGGSPSSGSQGPAPSPGGSGLLHAPTVVHQGRQKPSPARSSSSGNRMMGDVREMASNAGG